MMNKGDRGIKFPAMDMKTFNEMVNLPPARSPFDPDNIPYSLTVVQTLVLSAIRICSPI